MSVRILSALAEPGWGVKASELAEHLRQYKLRDVVGRLQALKRRGMVTYERGGESSPCGGLAGTGAVGDGRDNGTRPLGQYLAQERHR
jgi:hypothetical protein